MKNLFFFVLLLAVATLPAAGKMYAAQSNSISKVWGFSAPADLVVEGAITATPSVVMFPVRNTSTNSGGIMALDSLSGEKKWSFAISSDGAGICSTSSMNWLMLYPSSSREDGLVVVDCTTNCNGNACGFFALSISTGLVVWNYPTQSTSELHNFALDVDGGVFYANYLRTQSQVALTALNVSNGNVLWTHDLDAMPEVTCLSSQQGSNKDAMMLVTQHPAAPVRAFQGSTGAPAWTYNIDNNVVACSPSLVAVSNPNTGLFALDASSGSQLWKMASWIQFVFNTGNDVCVLQNTSIVLFVECLTGTVISSYAMSGIASVERSGMYVFVIDRNGTILIADPRGRLVKLLPWSCQTIFGSCQYYNAGSPNYIFSYLSTFVMGSNNNDKTFVVTQFATNGTMLSQLQAVEFQYFPPKVVPVLDNLAIFRDAANMYAVSVN
jgi:outer membrane protein assembly factor BamB